MLIIRKNHQQILMRSLFIWATILICSINISFAQNHTDYKLRKVVIDAGHGGWEPGAITKKCKEKDIVLNVALEVGKYIQENIPDVEVIYTRKTDVFIPLDQRAKIANDNHADLFISIHANANPSSRPYGTETYAMGLHKSQENLEVAQKENAVITLEKDYSTKYEGFDPKSAESYIIFSLLQNTNLEQSLLFASFVQKQFKERARRKDRGVKQAGFLVLKDIAAPRVLIELGFISNAKEERYLCSKQGQSYLASAIYRAFKDYKQQIESKSHYTIIEEKPEISSASQNAYFKIQIFSSGQQVDKANTAFSDYNEIESFHTNGIYKYAVGRFNNYEEAKTEHTSIKNKYPDSFIIAVKDGNIIPTAEALEKN